MVRKTRGNSIYFRANIRRSSYSYPGFNYSINRVLDTTISLRSIVRYSLLVLAFVIVFGSIFMLGRISAKPENISETPTAQLSGQTKQVQKPVETQVSSNAVAESEEDPITPDPSPSTQVVITRPSPAVDSGESPLPTANSLPDPAPETPEETCTLKHAVFDYNYTKVNFTISNFNKDVRGDNWATITSLKLTVTNNEPCTIINPTQLKLKITPKGKGTNWWDDEIFLPETFQRVAPGGTVTDTVAVHVSYSDIYGEKELKATLFDDYDLPMSTIKKYLFIE